MKNVANDIFLLLCTWLHTTIISHEKFINTIGTQRFSSVLEHGDGHEVGGADLRAGDGDLPTLLVDRRCNFSRRVDSYGEAHRRGNHRGRPAMAKRELNPKLDHPAFGRPGKGPASFFALANNSDHHRLVISLFVQTSPRMSPTVWPSA